MDYYRFHEIKVNSTNLLPTPPSTREKYLYVKRRNKYLNFFSVLSFSAITVSGFRFIHHNNTWPLYIFLGLSVFYFIVSLLVNTATKCFDLIKHLSLVSRWRHDTLRPAIDIFLPIAGEPIDVLNNTWSGVQRMKQYYTGEVHVYCLDDGASSDAKKLAAAYGFQYVVRPDRGEFKKAGNLRHGFKISTSPFIAIFDADFTPRHDFLDELLPYFIDNEAVGIVQSPQYFNVLSEQNWLERGAGAVQELFYRFSQVMRQHHNASICVGSNAIYRRKALEDTGGTALIEHSEDVHTGFNIRMYGWTIQYVPIILARGLCPAGMSAFFKQQYRWCRGSMSLLSSRKFWHTKMHLRTRLAYFSGFLYYISTALSSIYLPLIPLLLLIAFPAQIALQNYVLILPTLFFTQVIYPLWHNSTYGIEAWATRNVYGWAHLFAIYDTCKRQSMEWQPTGAISSKERRYFWFRILQLICNFVPACIWIALAAWRLISMNHVLFIPILCSGIYYLAICIKVTLYKETPHIESPKLSVHMRAMTRQTKNITLFEQRVG